MTYVENEKQPKEEVIQKSKSEAQLKKGSKGTETPERRPKSADKRKASKHHLKRQKRRYTFVDGNEEQIIKMVPEDKKGRDQALTPQIHAKNDWCSERLEDFRSPTARHPTICRKDTKASVAVEGLKPNKDRSPSSPALTRAVSALSNKFTEARLGGQQKKKVSIKEKFSEPPVQANVNVIRVNIASSEYMCGEGLPSEKSYLNITSKQFYT